MKSILIVTELFTMGGLETHICGEIKRLGELGLDVHLATGKSFDNALLPTGFSNVVSALPLGPEATPEELLFSINELRKIIREHSIDSVHIHPFASIIPAAIAAELEGIPFAITLHGPASLGGYGGPMYDFLVNNLILPNAKLVVAVSVETEKLLLDYVASESVAVIPNSVAFESSTDDTPAINEPDSHWLIVSRLDQFKIPGILDFCIKSKLAGITRVNIVGDGPAKADLSRQLDDHGLANYAIFVGASTQVHSLMQKATGVAGMGRVVLEAIAAKKPVVLVGYDGIKGVVNPRFLERAAEENLSGRGLPTIGPDTFSAQLKSIASGMNASELYALSKSRFNDLTNWSTFIDQLRATSPSIPTPLTGLYNALSLNLKTAVTQPPEALQAGSAGWFGQ